MASSSTSRSTLRSPISTRRSACCSSASWTATASRASTSRSTRPSKDWSAKLTEPDRRPVPLRPARGVDRAELSPTRAPRQRAARVDAPPLRLELTYSVTAWTKAVEDEHRLLSQVLAILFSHGALPADLLEGRPAAARGCARPRPSVGRPREEKADFWTSIGGQYKASIDFVVHIAVESGATFMRGPEVRMQTVRTRLNDGPPRNVRGAAPLRRHRPRPATASRSPTRG